MVCSKETPELSVEDVLGLRPAVETHDHQGTVRSTPHYNKK